MDDAAASLLADSPHLRSLVVLRFGWCELTEAGERLLAESPNLPMLRVIDAFSHDRCVRQAVERAATEGVLEFRPYEEPGDVDLFAATNLHLLETLAGPVAEVRAVWVNLDAGVLRRLLAVPGVRRLSLHASLDGDESARVLAEAAPEGLEAAELSYADITDAGAVRLARSPRLAGLRSLDLSDNPLTGAGVAALAASPYLTGLSELSLERIPLGDQVAALLPASVFPHIRRLHVFGVTERAVAALKARYGEALRISS